MIDIRPLPYKIDGLRFLQSDATKLENIPDNSIESLSSLHAVEHFGLGRYGDQINPEAWRTAILSMQRVVKTDGKLYLSVPIGTENRLYFNAHRMFEIHMIPTVLTEMELEKFVYIDNFEIIEILPGSFSDVQLQKDYLCGIYVFRKRRCENRGK